MGVGECAGEVVSPIEFALTSCEREVFEAQLHLDNGEYASAGRTAYESMLHGAMALLDWKLVPFERTPDGIVGKFRVQFYDTQLFFDPFAGGKFAQYFFAAHEHADVRLDVDSAHRLVEEAQLFIEACHSCHGRLIAQRAAV
jgi:sulfite reductase (ferredoxin)